MQTYEYLFTALIIIAILLAASSMIAMISDPSQGVAEKEQLKVAAQKFLAQVLLDGGEPVDWGSNINIGAANPPTTFGLAEHSEIAREAYVLDPYKVLRLNSTLCQSDKTKALYIHPANVTTLLNLGHEYGIALEVFPALFVNASDLSGGDRYEIKVNSEYGDVPISGAIVTARMFYYNGTNQNVGATSNLTATTDSEGKCVIDFGSNVMENKVVCVVVDFNDLRVIRVFPSPDVYPLAHFFGNRLYGDDGLSGNVTEIVVMKKAGEYVIENVTFPISRVGEGEFDVAYIEPETVAIVGVSNTLDGARLIAASKEINVKYSSMPDVWSFPFAYSMERTVSIGGSAYFVRLYLWRMSW